MRFRIRFSLFCVILTSLVSCKKETAWDIDAAFPIAKSHLDLRNFFGDSLFKADPSGLLHLDYTAQILNLTMDNLVKLPDTAITIGYISFFNASLNPGDLIYTNASTPANQEITFDVANGVQLNKAIVRSGYLKIEYLNTYAQPINFDYDINSAKLWGTVFHVNQVIPGGSSSSPASFTSYYSLKDYELNLTGIANNKINTLVQTYSIKTDPSGVADVLHLGEGLNIKLSFIDIVPEYVQGYFGQQDLTFGPDSAHFGLLNNFNTSNFKLTQSSFQFSIINELGVELSSTINKLKSIKINPYNAITLNSGSLLQSINVNRAGKTNVPSNPVFPVVKNITLNHSNSNLNPFLENIPNYLSYSVKAKLNPLGNISAGNDFAYYGHGLKVMAHVDIPLAVSADYFKLISYNNTDFNELKQLNNVNSCELTLTAKNNYPFYAKLQAYLLDESNTVIDSLFLPTDNKINAALTDVSNTVINAVDTKIVFTIANTKLEHLKQCKQIKFVSAMYFSNQPTPIKITADSYLDLILSANVNYTSKL